MGTQYFRITNWGQYQHYKDRNPPWVKLHKEMLTSQTWVALDDASKLLAIACILVAAVRDNRIPLNPGYIKRIAYLDQTPDLAPLFDVGFIEMIADAPQVNDSANADASNSLASASNPLASGTERYPQRTENREERKDTMSGKPDDTPKVNGKEARSLLTYLNEKSGKSFQPVRANLDMIAARLKEYPADDLKAMVDRKCAEWRNDDKMATYLRPATLFNATKCAQYVGERKTPRRPDYV